MADALGLSSPGTSGDSEPTGLKRSTGSAVMATTRLSSNGSTVDEVQIPDAGQDAAIAEAIKKVSHVPHILRIGTTFKNDERLLLTHRIQLGSFAQFLAQALARIDVCSFRRAAIRTAGD